MSTLRTRNELYSESSDLVSRHRHLVFLHLLPNRCPPKKKTIGIMPVSPEELVRLLAILATEENMKVTVKESLKGGAMAGVGAIVGGFCGGPVGIAIGGTLGGVMARWKYKGNCRPVTDILTELTKEQRDLVHVHFQPLLGDCIVDDFSSMTRLVSQDGEFRARMVQSLKAFITDTLKLPLLEEVITRGKAE